MRCNVSDIPGDNLVPAPLLRPLALAEPALFLCDHQHTTGRAAVPKSPVPRSQSPVYWDWALWSQGWVFPWRVCLGHFRQS